MNADAPKSFFLSFNNPISKFSFHESRVRKTAKGLLWRCTKIFLKMYVFLTYHSCPFSIFYTSESLDPLNCEGKIHCFFEFMKCVSIDSFETTWRSTSIHEVCLEWGTYGCHSPMFIDNIERYMVRVTYICLHINIYIAIK